MTSNVLKKVKSKAKDLVKKVADAVKHKSDSSDNSKNKKSSYEALPGSPNTPVRSPSEKRAAKDRASLPATSPVQERFPID